MMLSSNELDECLDKLFIQELELFLNSVPYAKHLTDPEQELHEEYYLRHRIETIKRIRLTSKMDALALSSMVDEDYEAARWWAQYTATELDHDRLYMADLKKHGFTQESIEKVEPFQSTRSLIEYLMENISIMGALPAVAYSLFVEWNSQNYSHKVVEKAEKQFSAPYVLGSKRHCKIDQDEKHYKTMLNIAHRLLMKHGNAKILFQLIIDISSLFRDYFHELYESSVLHPNPSWK